MSGATYRCLYSTMMALDTTDMSDKSLTRSALHNKPVIFIKFRGFIYLAFESFNDWHFDPVPFV